MNRGSKPSDSNLYNQSIDFQIFQILIPFVHREGDFYSGGVAESCVYSSAIILYYSIDLCTNALTHTKADKFTSYASSPHHPE